MVRQSGWYDPFVLKRTRLLIRIVLLLIGVAIIVLQHRGIVCPLRSIYFNF